ncbi:AAA+ ATPase domain-containing protein [Tanacetum coccineum]
MSDLFGSTFSMFQSKQETKGGTLRRQSSASDFGSRGSEAFSNPPNLRRNASSSANINELASKCTPPNPAPLRRTSSLSFDEKLFVQTLYKVLTFISNNSPIVLYLRDVEKLLCRSQRVYTLFQKYWSQVVDSEKDYRQVDERITSVFPYIIEIKPPQEENYLEGKSVKKDTSKEAKAKDTAVPKPETKAESTRACEAEASAPKTGDNVTPAAAPKAPEVPADNEFEKRIRPEVIPASEIGVTFADIGALDDIKDSLQELVMLPLQRPDLDNNACKGHRQRSRAGEHEAMRKIKHEFMTHWDGLLTKPGERILVLAATNQPFDLDEAIIRRFERRIMVGLPSVEYRGKILQTLLSKEHIEEGLNFSELATMTEGYTGSDLKEKKRIAESGEGPQSPEEAIEEKVITIRPLKMEDFREAKNQVFFSPSIK